MPKNCFIMNFQILVLRVEPGPRELRLKGVFLIIFLKVYFIDHIFVPCQILEKPIVIILIKLGRHHTGRSYWQYCVILCIRGAVHLVLREVRMYGRGRASHIILRGRPRAQPLFKGPHIYKIYW